MDGVPCVRPATGKFEKLLAAVHSQLTEGEKHLTTFAKKCGDNAAAYPPKQITRRITGTLDYRRCFCCGDIVQSL